MGTNEKRRRASRDEVLTYEDITDVGGAPPSKKARTEARTSLFVRSLPKSATAESLTQFFSEHFPVKHAAVILDKNTKESRGYGFVTFTDADDAREAMAKFNKHLIDGRHIQLDIAEPRHRDAKARAEDPEAAARYDNEKRRRKQEEEEARRPPKLIIRNLPWSIKESEQLAALFRSFGRVNYADLPQKKGRQSGFGFVTIRGRKNAERAMEALNGKEIDGRTIAVDWAADKKTWEEEKVKELAAEREAKKAAKKANRQKNSRKQDDDEEKRPEINVVTKGGDDFDPDADLMAFMEKLKGFDTEDEDDEEENVVDENTDSTEEDESEDGADDDVEDEDENADLESEVQHPKRTTDNTSTVFIRNVPYTTTDEVLKSHFSKFGPVRYARVVIDKTTERPAGTGFVCFFNPDVSKACIRGSPRPQPVAKGHKQSILQDHAADTDGRYTLDGRVLYVAQAVTKDEASRLADEGPAGKKKRESDKRRFYLLSEGTIPRNSPLYAALAPSEIKMRDASLAQRKKLVQNNPSLHLSLTRLALRNIPHNMDSKALKALAREAVVGFAKDVKEGHRLPLSKEEIARGGQEDRESERHRKEKGKGVVKQAKIVFEDTKGTKVTEEIGGGKSRGYGFIEFSSHRWALMGLRWLNGHALKNAGGKTQRLIVEFAIENVQVVARRRDAQAKALARQQPIAPKQESAIPASRSQQTSMFSGKTDKKGKGKKEQELESSSEEDSGKLDKATLIKQKQISRKRVMRKKKATMRHGAK